MKYYLLIFIYITQQTDFAITKNFICFFEKEAKALKGTVNGASCGPPFIDCHVRFTTVSFKPLSKQNLLDYSSFSILKFELQFTIKGTCGFKH